MYLESCEDLQKGILWWEKHGIPITMNSDLTKKSQSLSDWNEYSNERSC
jgi:hypothetical protein